MRFHEVSGRSRAVLWGVIKFKRFSAGVKGISGAFMGVPWDLRAFQGCYWSLQGVSQVSGVAVAFHWATEAMRAPSGVSGAFLEYSKESQRVSGSLQGPPVFSGAFQGFSKGFQGHPVRFQWVLSSPKGAQRHVTLDILGSLGEFLERYMGFLGVSETFQKVSSCVRGVSREFEWVSGMFPWVS